mmetsp:Transcript_25936/g.42398  ORF Transcript_25936/g.42398 Transcript_25936/m.42398 type:complete len:200 (-) Transcript_25936:514-1113(-)
MRHRIVIQLMNNVGEIRETLVLLAAPTLILCALLHQFGRRQQRRRCGDMAAAVRIVLDPLVKVGGEPLILVLPILDDVVLLEILIVQDLVLFLDLQQLTVVVANTLVLRIQSRRQCLLKMLLVLIVLALHFLIATRHQSQLRRHLTHFRVQFIVLTTRLLFLRRQRLHRLLVHLNLVLECAILVEKHIKRTTRRRDVLQ